MNIIITDNATEMVEQGKSIIEEKKNIYSPKMMKTLYSIIDEYMKAHNDVKVDFIHDESSLLEIANANDNSLAIHMPALGKSDIFDFVARDAVLPRKSFSMGHASEKRYYLESKMIKG